MKRIITVILAFSLIFCLIPLSNLLTASATNVVTLTSTAANQTDSAKITYAGLASATSAKNAMGGDAWTYDCLTTSSNVSIKGYYNGTTYGSYGTKASKLADGVLNTTGNEDGGWNWSDSWNKISEYDAKTGYPEKLYTRDGVTYAVADWTGNSYIDYTINLGEIYDIKGFLIGNASANLRVGSYEIYVGDSADTLYSSAPVATFAIDESLWFNNEGNKGTPSNAIKNNAIDTWKVANDTTIKGSYVGFRIKQMSVSMTTTLTSGAAYLRSTLRLSELAVYGEEYHECAYTLHKYDENQYWTECTCGKSSAKKNYSDDSRFTATAHMGDTATYMSDVNIADSILAGKYPLAAYYLNKDGNITTRTRRECVVYDNGSNYINNADNSATWNALNLTRADTVKEFGLGGTGLSYAVYENGVIVDCFNDESKRYIDMVYDFGNGYNVSDLAIYSHTSEGLTLYKYRISFARTEEELFTDTAVTSDVLTNFGNYIKIACNEDIPAKYFGIRIIAGMTPLVANTNPTLAENLTNFRLNNISIFGTPCEHKDTTPSYDTTNHYDLCDACGEKLNSVAHSYTIESNDESHRKICECGFKTALESHSYSDKSDNEKHWKECECGVIKANTNCYFRFVDNSAEKHKIYCSCSYMDKDASHTYNATFDKDYHWNECICGNIANKYAHEFEELADGSKICSCGAVSKIHQIDFLGENDQVVYTAYVENGETISEEILAEAKEKASSSFVYGYVFDDFDTDTSGIIESALTIGCKRKQAEETYSITIKSFKKDDNGQPIVETFESKFDSSYKITISDANSWKINDQIVASGNAVEIYVSGDMYIEALESNATEASIGIVSSAYRNKKFVIIAMANTMGGKITESGVEYTDGNRIVTVKSKYTNDSMFMTGLKNAPETTTARAYMVIDGSKVYSKWVNLEIKDEDIIIERPLTDASISSGVKFDSAEDEDADLEGTVWEDSSIEEANNIVNDVALKRAEYNAITLIEGTATATDDRVINVNNNASGIKYTDFMGIGCNYFPTNGSYLAQVGYGQIGAYDEINSKRLNDSAPRYARVWFQIDWMITNELEKQGKDFKDYADDWENNPDYVNYMNGIYSWENDEFLSFVNSCKMLEETNTEIYLAFGWKVGERVRDWFSNHPTNTAQGAPRDTLAYANAAAALFKYMREEHGMGNFNILSFYNEPQPSNNYAGGGTDFSDIGDNRIAMMNVIRDCYNKFNSDEILEDVKIMGSDITSTIAYDSSLNMNAYLKSHINDMIDAYTYHYYYPMWDPWRSGNNPADLVAHDEYFKFASLNRKWFKDGTDKMIFNTEYYAGTWSDNSWNSNNYKGWLGSNTSGFIQTANSGTNGLFKWSFVGSYLAPPVGGTTGEYEQGSWNIPKSATSVTQVFESYYSDTILNQYIERNSNVHDVNWTGEDLHVAAFTSKNGNNFALVVESSDKQTATRTLTVNLQKSLGKKTLYVYRHNFNTVLNSNASIPRYVSKISKVTTSFSYTLPGQYGVYVFSTIAPKKQVEVIRPGTSHPAVYNECSVDGSVTINYRMLDCTSSDEVVWEVKRYSCAIEYDENGVQLKRKEKTSSDDLGTITHNKTAKSITYTPAADAKPYDVVAIRGTIKGTNRFTAAIIEIR